MIGDDVIKRLEGLSLRRLSHEPAWRAIQALAAPDASDFTGTALGSSTDTIGGSTAADRSRKQYDSTAVWCVDRLSSGIEALVIPMSEYWHDLGPESIKKRATDDEKLWLESQRNLLFETRYDADSGFVAASQTAMRRMSAFGNGFFMVEESFDGKSHIKYWFIPLAESFIAVDRYGVPNTFLRPFTLSAAQAVADYGDRVSARIKAAAADPRQMDQRFRFVMMVSPRGDVGSRPGVLGSPYASVHVETETRQVVKEGGFYDFPIVDFRWLPEPTQEWGEGPFQKALTDIKTINAMAKNELIASQQAVNPPLLMANAGIMTRPNAAPGSVTMGGIAPNGQRLVDTMFTGQRLDFASTVLAMKREQLKEATYINLFQVLVKNPQMSATEAMLRADEKGELLGPAGTRLQQSLSRMVDREMNILARKGLYDPKSFYAPPRSVKNVKEMVKPAMGGPLARLRKAKEVKGTMDLLNILSPLAQVKPDVVDRINPDRTIDGLSERLGVPREFLNTDEELAAIRQERAEQNELAQQAAIAKDMAAAGKQGAEALQTMGAM